MSKLLTEEAAFKAAEQFKNELIRRFSDILRCGNIQTDQMLRIPAIKTWVPLVIQRSFEDLDNIYMDRDQTLIWSCDSTFFPGQWPTMKEKIASRALPQSTTPRIQRTIQSRFDPAEDR